jgi:NAD+ synthetase
MDYDFNKVLTNLGCGLQQYCERNNIKSLVLGISGGIDSTLTAAIAKLVADAVDIPLYGVSMPTVTNASEEKIAANMVGDAFCDAFVTQPINQLYDTAETVLHSVMKNLGYPQESAKIAKGNIKARIRMMTLYHIASMTGGIVLDTDNATEHFTGFFTVHGDEGDIGVLRALNKSAIFKFVDWMIEQTELFSEEQINALKASRALNPTDGNGVGCDLDQFGLPTYDEVDKVVSGEETENVGNVMKLHKKTFFKRKQRPFFIGLDGCAYSGNGVTKV